MKKILITGSKGTIGTILSKELSDYDITGFDLPEHDARNYEAVKSAIVGHDTVIHLAWNTAVDHVGAELIHTDNTQMMFNVYRAAYEIKIPRVIMASSVHVDDDSIWQGPELMKTNTVPSPDSVYGAHKVFMEALGKFYAKKGLQTVCIRFMGLSVDNKPSEELHERRKWFSHHDCGALVRAILEAPPVPENFAILYGVSNNKGRIYDISNPFGWEPEDGV